MCVCVCCVPFDQTNHIGPLKLHSAAHPCLGSIAILRCTNFICRFTKYTNARATFPLLHATILYISAQFTTVLMECIEENYEWISIL